MWRLGAFLAWPLAEIALFVLIGGEIGLWATLAWVLLSGFLGMLILRLEVARGAVMLRQGARGGVGLREGAAVGGLFRALAGVMLILPGFLTDAIGLLLLLPPVQKALSAAVMSRVTIVGAGMASGGRSRPAGEDVIDGEWIEVPPEAAARGGRPSGWVEDQTGDRNGRDGRY
ncbi:FxsA family protein [Neotabrizicola sp. VNH66]|uniref:FxsA family protein n=1 Tax=Neotabrizicola sp. VNH66 TaxID=3400918 RepID=UPI003C122515